MRVGWLGDHHDWQGGAELTMQAFKDAAPKGVDITDCPPREVKPGLDRYVIGNCTQYTMHDLVPLSGKPVFKYVNDVWPHGDDAVRSALLETATLIFCSPLHRDRFPHKCEGGEIIPPPIDLDRFREVADSDAREGTCWMGMAFYGKGIQQTQEWAAKNGPVDFYGMGPMAPQSPLMPLKGHVPYEQVPEVLARYERFLFLPTQLEPFGRTVVEAWAAGCELVVNKNLGCLHYIENEPEKLETSVEDFWALVMK